MATKNNHYQQQNHNTFVSTLAKILYQILQCLHHLNNIGNPQQDGIKIRAFQKKHKELETFFKPAQSEGTQFVHFIQNLTHQFFENASIGLIQHYQSLLKTHTSDLQSMAIHPTTLKNAKQLCLKWAHNNFKSKLHQNTISTFHSKVNNIVTNPTHNPYDTHTPPVEATHHHSSPPSNSHNSTTNTSTHTHPAPAQEPRPTTSVPTNTTGHRSHNTFSHHKSTTKSHNHSNLLSSDRNVQGHMDPLSNFYPCKFKYKDKIYKSTEHAYQITKATSLQEHDLAYKIQCTNTASKAKYKSKPLKTHPNISQWYKIEVDVMRDILHEKAQQIGLFIALEHRQM